MAEGQRSASATKPTQHLINLGHMTEPTRDAASYLAQWDNSALPLRPHRTARDCECEDREGDSSATWSVTLRFLILQGQKPCPTTSSIPYFLKLDKRTRSLSIFYSPYSMPLHGFLDIYSALWYYWLSFRMWLGIPLWSDQLLSSASFLTHLL